MTSCARPGITSPLSSAAGLEMDQQARSEGAGGCIHPCTNLLQRYPALIAGFSAVDDALRFRTASSEASLCWNHFQQQPLRRTSRGKVALNVCEGYSAAVEALEAQWRSLVAADRYQRSAMLRREHGHRRLTGGTLEPRSLWLLPAQSTQLAPSSPVVGL